MNDERDYITVAEAATYNEAGRITGMVNQAIGFTYDWQDEGKRIMLGDAGFDMATFRSSRFVDLSGVEPVLRDLPVFEGEFARPSLPAGEETILPGVPACTVSFAGPVTGTHEHEGGDLEIGFTVPGTYTISFEAFPAMPVALTLTVTD